MTVERVYSIWDYYDGILTGVADYRGSPHYFERASVEERDQLPAFTLFPITEVELAEVVQREHLLRAWEAKFHEGKVEESSHPGAAGQGASYAELQATFRARAAVSVNPPCRSTAEFLPVPGQTPGLKGVMPELQVTWHDAA